MFGQGRTAHAPRDPTTARADDAASSRAGRDVLLAVVSSRLLVAVTAAVTAAAVTAPTGPGIPPPGVREIGGLSHPFGGGWLSGALDAVFTPLVRWDALWYLQISRGGYQPLELVAGNPGQRPAFFPLYPLLVQLLGGWAGDGARLLVATLLSLLAFAVGLAVVHRLATLELGPRAAHGAVLVMAFWPGPFFSAPYTEGLFLALSAGAFLAARTDRWWLAGLLGAFASGTRNTGVLLVVPLLVLYLYGPRTRTSAPPGPQARWRPVFPVRPDVLWLGLVPAGLVAYCVYLQVELGNWQAFRTAQETFGRPGLTTPFTTLRLALAGVYHAVRDTVTALAHADLPGVAVTGSGGSNVLNFAVLALVALAAVGVARRLPPAYAAYVVVAIAPTLVVPFGGDALRSLPRFVSVLFPIGIWLGYELTRRRLLAPAIGLGATVLAATTVAFTLWLPYV